MKAELVVAGLEVGPLEQRPVNTAIAIGGDGLDQHAGAVEAIEIDA